MKPVFPTLNSCTYLNTPAQGLMSVELADYRKSLIDKQLESGSAFTDTAPKFLNQVRATLASFLDAPVSSTGLVPNFSFAFNSLLDVFSPKSRFLLVEEDYPSMNFPVEAREFHCDYVVIDQHLEQNIADAVKRFQPHILCLSVVQYLSGIKIDLEFLKQLKDDYPELIIIADATQYIGVEPFCFRESGIDILLASCYKWMHAGNGNAFICFKEEAAYCSKPHNISYHADHPFTNERGSFMGLFEPGHLDLAAFGSLKKAIELLQNYGAQQIADDIEAMSIPAKTALAQRGLLDETVVQRKVHSSIFNIKGGNDLFNVLQEANIICAQRGGGIRIGFSYFNDQEDLNKLLRVLDNFYQYNN
jgi:selenocysteine lyase/cysteine desulfurase